MNFQTASAAFGYQDFILVKADRAAVDRALSVILSGQDGHGAPAMEWQPGALTRIFLRLIGLQPATFDARMTEGAEAFEAAREASADHSGGYSRHRGAGARPGEPMTRAAPPVYTADTDEEMFADGFDDIRVSTPLAAPGWVLIELREMVSGLCMHALSLSGELDGTDVLYFRRSGASAAEKNYDFHVYRGFEPVRRVLCHATWPEGDESQEWWEGISDGDPTEYEPEGLYDGTDERTLLDNARIEAILGRIGLSFDTLLTPGATDAPVLYSRRAGGEPLT